MLSSAERQAGRWSEVRLADLPHTVSVARGVAVARAEAGMVVIGQPCRLIIITLISLSIIVTGVCDMDRTEHAPNS